MTAACVPVIHLRRLRFRWLLLSAALFGAVGTLALAPFSIWPALLFPFAGLTWLLDAAVRDGMPSATRAALGARLGLMLGLGWFGASVWWVGEAFFVNPEAHAALAAPVIVALVVLLATFWAIAAAIAAAIWRPAHQWRIVVLAAAFLFAEVLRGHAFSGFPWNLPAHGLIGNLPLAQTARLTGTYGLSFLVVLWAATVALLNRGQWRNATVAFAIATFLAAQGYGIWVLAADPVTRPAAPATPVVRVVQPNVPQTEKWRPVNRQRIFADLLRLSAIPQGAEPDIVVWPESAVPFLIEEEPEALAAIADMLRPGQWLITGAIRRAARQGPDRRKLFNSILVIDHEGRIVARYDKRKLVPLGEFLPFASVLEPLGLRKIVAIPQGFLAGRDHRPVRVPGLPPFIGLICYEAVFPELAAAPGAHWLLAVSNDAWFGNGIGPHQHLAIARFRAIETGRPMIRAANTGISAIIDARGRLRQQLELLRRGIVQGRLPHHP